MMNLHENSRRAPLAGTLLLFALLGFALPARAVTSTQFTSVNLGGDDAPVFSRDGGSVFYSTRATGFPYIFRKAVGAPMNTSGTRLTGWTLDEYQVTIAADDSYAMLCVGDSLNSRHLYRCPATGGAPLTKVTYGPFYDIDPDWFGSASGKVAFTSNRGGSGFQIWTLVPNGTLPAITFTQVTDAGHNDTQPSFSPDGQKIVFSSDRGSGTQLFVSSFDGSSWGVPLQLTSGGGSKTCPSWSPNGLHIAYELSGGSNSELWVVEANGTNPRVITATGTYDARPAWAPNGDGMAFVSDRSGAQYIWIAEGISTPAAPDTWGRVKDLYRR